MKNKLAYICSPYRGNAYKRIRNIAYARHITRVALELGYTPIATHLYLPQILNDDIPAQRRQEMEKADHEEKQSFGIMAAAQIKKYTS